ncbi:hypothetical protein [Blastopirellula marina]|uniref:Uncharacterized protein n=1 Tax=Blastopirellula marina TaxID=124 RepID=A0A2S8GHR5_9BACT|nr:hypothetical protein [Blastopirellula marina]PQO28988.1 hypothetical protein C5Y98_22520 [Blastopirellula marina]PQO43861.1 hypothetical protein C5Y93_21995 [Blastopirellula marina]PTL42260.1 hypothetical protein C5Y97_22530 [Blastopirellula marina]
MSEDPAIPHTYEQWRDCITVRCGIALTPTFVRERLAELRDTKHQRTKKFGEHYGPEYLACVVDWFERAGKDLGV